MPRPLAVLLLLLACGWLTAVASAQVFYEPVQYQYSAYGQTFYYGGHDPRVFDFAAADIARTSYSSVVHPVHVVGRARIYSDVIPFTNLADNSYTSYGGFTVADARNEAYANVPRYFRKRDLLRAAVMTDEGSLVVPAQAQPHIDIHVVRPFANGAGVGEVPKGTILIIPKKLLEPPLKAKEPPAVVTSAQQ
jgi:hypothetical protein